MEKLFRFFAILFLFTSCGSGKESDESTKYYFYSKTAPESKQPDFYIVLKSEVTDGKRVDQYLHYSFNGKTYDYFTCQQNVYILESDSLLRVANKKDNVYHLTSFKKGLCDTIPSGTGNQDMEVNCYLGKEWTQIDNENVKGHHIKTTIHSHAVIEKDSYYDDKMYLINENGNIPFGFGPYKIQRVKTLPFKFDIGQKCI